MRRGSPGSLALFTPSVAAPSSFPFACASSLRGFLLFRFGTNLGGVMAQQLNCLTLLSKFFLLSRPSVPSFITQNQVAPSQSFFNNLLISYHVLGTAIIKTTLRRVVALPIAQGPVIRGAILKFSKNFEQGAQYFNHC